ncbi:leucine-rich repeat protein [Salmonella enterica subsp. enterica serovar Agona str. 241981]|nr:leucine-rich repeat protein [Salmonella enterica subsp. enterica serovar Agona str. 241981]
MLLVARNQLTSLPPLPAGLQMLSVAGNQLTACRRCRQDYGGCW